jgi:DNA-binding NtrC family response regulator
LTKDFSEFYPSLPFTDSNTLINDRFSSDDPNVKADESSFKRIVAVIDDDIDITTLFHDILCENVLEASVYAFNDPVQALKHFAENQSNYALVISDLRIPGLNGLELLKKIKNGNPKVRTILMSAYNFDEDPTYVEYMKEGVIDNSIEKPVTIQRLCERVRDELNEYQTMTM